jgi:hypothetical protein
MKRKKPTSPVPTLNADPLEVDVEKELSPADRKFLADQEKIIEAGRKTFVAVGTALQKIRDHKNGILYKRYGTFDDYCNQRWEFGRVYAHRLMEATDIYNKMLPMGNKSSVKLLPSSERHIRPLVQLRTPKKQWQAWEAAVVAVGDNPIRGLDVEKEVRAIIKNEGLAKPSSSKKPKAKPKSYQLKAADLKTIQKKLTQLRKEIANLEGAPNAASLIEDIEALLPDTGEA